MRIKFRRTLGDALGPKHYNLSVNSTIMVLFTSPALGGSHLWIRAARGPHLKTEPNCLKGSCKSVDGARDENGTEIFRIDRFRFLYYEPFFNMKNC
jgi:hypothetical protein